MSHTTGTPAAAQSSLERFAAYVSSRGIAAEIIDCGSSTLTVAQAAEAVGCEPGQVLKTLLFHDGKQGFVAAIAAGFSRIDTVKLLGASSLTSARLASPKIMLERLGYPAGGVPPIDLPADIAVIVDIGAAGLTTCYAGAGSTRHLVILDPRIIIQHNNATIAQIVEAGTYSGCQ